MKKNNSTISDIYQSPQCITLTVEAGGVLATSDKETDLYIKDPIWNTDGDYGLE